MLNVDGNQVSVPHIVCVTRPHPKAVQSPAGYGFEIMFAGGAQLDLRYPDQATCSIAHTALLKAIKDANL